MGSDAHAAEARSRAGQAQHKRKQQPIDMPGLKGRLHQRRQALPHVG